jgi:hypothetical protein
MLTSEREEQLEEVTRQALVAAEQGRWDVVRACYSRRGDVLTQGTVSALLAERLGQVDRVIQERARVAQAAVGQVIGAVESIRAKRRMLTAQVVSTSDNGQRVDRLA